MRPGGSPRTSSSLAGCCVSRSNPDELVSHLNALQSRLKIFKGRRGDAPSFLRSTVPCKPLRRVVPVGSAHHPRHHGYDRHASGAVAASGQLRAGPYDVCRTPATCQSVSTARQKFGTGRMD
jgi:hypothetical protein